MTLNVSVKHESGDKYAAKIETSTGEVYYLKPGESVSLVLYDDKSYKTSEASIQEALDYEALKNAQTAEKVAAEQPAEESKADEGVAAESETQESAAVENSESSEEKAAE